MQLMHATIRRRSTLLFITALNIHLIYMQIYSVWFMQVYSRKSNATQMSSPTVGEDVQKEHTDEDADSAVGL